MSELEFYSNMIWVVVVSVRQIDTVSEIIPSNVAFSLTLIRISLSICSIISLHLTFRRPNLQEHCEIQNQSKFVRLEQVIVVIDQALHAKAKRYCMEAHVHTCKRHGHFPYHRELTRLKWEMVIRC